jgi:CAAX prenyl protease-like protein
MDPNFSSGRADHVDSGPLGIGASSVPYIAPFFAFLIFLAARKALDSDLVEQIVCLSAVTLVIIRWSRPVLDVRLRHFGGTLLLGVAVFLLWVAPDNLFPGYRNHWLFSNAITGQVTAGISGASRSNPLVLVLRTVRASLLVPILEELFWRAWLMRWLIRPDFEKVPLGTYSRNAFWIVAVLFAAVHGPYWEVGLLTGAIYNWWMIHTKSLGDLIWTHAITNACLSLYVIFAGRWEYWS